MMDDLEQKSELDEAQEKLVSEASTPAPKIEIKFVADPNNGETKIDISEVRHAFVGMGKEELMKFANDPFWVKMRWFLFLLFWLIWFGMLAGALAIIILAPKCTSNVPSKWYEETPIYEVNVSNFKDAINEDGIGDFIGLEERIDYVKDLGINTILLNNILPTAFGTNDVMDFMSVNPQYGSLNDFKRLISKCKNKGLHLIMEIELNSVSKKHNWFLEDASGSDLYNDFFVWSRPSKYYGDEPLPPNNWHSVTGGSAWEWNEERKQFYLHQFGAEQPDLNFRNPKVFSYFTEVLKFWLDLGIDGIHLNKAEYLVENEKLLNESTSMSVGTIHDEYDFNFHSHTTYLPETLEILSRFADIVKNKSGIFSVSGTRYGDSLKKADLIHRTIRINDDFTAEKLKKLLNNRMEKESQAWAWTCNLKEECDSNIISGLQATFLMLPGVPVIKSGTELGLSSSSIFQWDSSQKNQGFTNSEPYKALTDPSAFGDLNVATEKNITDSYYHTFKTMIHERHSLSIQQGTINMAVLDSTVLAIKRAKSGNPSYIFAFNLDINEREIALNHFDGVPEKLKVIARSSNFSFPARTNLASALLKVPGQSYILVQYISDSEEASSS